MTRCRRWVAASAVAVVVVVWAATPTTTPPADATPPAAPSEWLHPAPGHPWRFPADHWSKPGYRNEWWYFTGQLDSLDQPGRSFGFQLTFFRVGLLPRAPALDSAWAAGDAVMGHAAVTDLTRGEHRFSEVLFRAVPLLGGFGSFPDPLVAWSRAPAGSPGRWTLAWNGRAFDLELADRGAATALRLETSPEKPLAFQGPGGLSRKSAAPGYASLYYSFTRLAATGVVELAGERHRVAGRAWMDREISSSQLGPSQVGWDWFALQLGDGRDLMLYVLRRAGGEADYRSATVIAPDGAAEHLAPEAWQVRSTRRWRSRRTGAEYPARWEVEVPGHGIRIAVEPILADQENVAALAGLHYWEGAVRVLDAAGVEAGRGYVELTGYGEKNRPPL